MSELIKSSAKILVIAGLTIGFSVVSFAQSATSIVGSINNQKAVNNTQATPANGGIGNAQPMNGGTSGGHSGGSEGGHNGGSDGGHDGGGGCVPEPMSMLALGIGSGIVFLKKRAKKA